MTRRRRAGVILAAVSVAAVATACGGGGDDGRSADPPAFEDGVRVYDETGTSLTEDEIADLQAQAEELGDTVDADVVLVVRELDADSDDTFEQVEAIQQAWVAETGVAQETAVAFLVNREPGSDTEARAGLFVGQTFQDGNVPTDEQEGIVEDGLIPSLRDGDVAGSFAAGLGQFEGAALNPPIESTGRVVGTAALGSWTSPGVWGSALVAALLLALGFGVDRNRRTSRGVPPTTARPDDLPPALGAALANGAPRNEGLAATVLDLARRGALRFEPEDERPGKETLRVVLLDRSRAGDALGEDAWTTLEAQAADGVVEAKRLRAALSNPSAHNAAVRESLERAGFHDPAGARRRTLLITLAFVALALMVAVVVLTAFAESWWGAAAAGLFLVASLVLFVLSGRTLPFTRAGMERSAAWQGYHEGLKRAASAGPGGRDVDLDAALPDLTAQGLGSRWKSRLQAADESGLSPAYLATAQAASFPAYWLLFSATTTSTTGTTVSGGGAGGGGGAAGST